MRSYRLLLLDQSGFLLESKSIACMEDQEAVTVAEAEVHKCEYVEVWNGGRPVCMCARPLKQRTSLAWQRFFSTGAFGSSQALRPDLYRNGSHQCQEGRKSGMTARMLLFTGR
jgi:hypothetical protein